MDTMCWIEHVTKTEHLAETDYYTIVNFLYFVRVKH